jgi:uncharacterized protein (UPF0335 family)
MQEKPRSKPYQQPNRGTDMEDINQELLQIVERIEAQNATIADETEVRKAIYAEAKSSGFDVKVLRKVVALRKKRADEVAEEDAIEMMYREALGM